MGRSVYRMVTGSGNDVDMTGDFDHSVTAIALK